MNGHPETSTSPLEPVSPTIAAGRKRCDNCGKFFPLSGQNPANDKKRRFCSTPCRNEFNRYGSSYGVLKDKLRKLIETESKEAAAKTFAPLVAELIAKPEFVEKLVELALNAQVFHDAMRAAGFIPRSDVALELKSLERKLKASIRRVSQKARNASPLAPSKPARFQKPKRRAQGRPQAKRASVKISTRRR